MTSDNPWTDTLFQSFLSESTRRVGDAKPKALSPLPPRSDIIRFTVGNPDPDTLPTTALSQAAQSILKQDPLLALHYGPASGLFELRKLIAQQLYSEQESAPSPEEISLTSGTTQSLHIICQAFLDPGDVVIAEEPAWRGFSRMAAACGAEVVPLPLDEQGPLIDAIAEKVAQLLAQGRRLKLLYTIPTFRNPTGSTMSLERRQALIEFAARQRMLLLEDDAYTELRFRGERLPSLFALAGGEGVLKLGTFSKIIATGLRVGWIQGKTAYLDATLRVRFDNGTSPFVSRVIAEYMRNGALKEHIAQVRTLYATKHDLLCQALSNYCLEDCTWTPADGGFFAWLTLPDRFDVQEVLRLGEEEGIAAARGASFFITQGGMQNIRLCFGGVPMSQIEEGVCRLASALKRASA